LGESPTAAEVSGWCDTRCTTVRSWVLSPSSRRRRCHRSTIRALRRPSVLRPGVPCDSVRAAGIIPRAARRGGEGASGAPGQSAGKQRLWSVPSPSDACRPLRSVAQSPLIRPARPRCARPEIRPARRRGFPRQRRGTRWPLPARMRRPIRIVEPAERRATDRSVRGRPEGPCPRARAVSSWRSRVDVRDRRCSGPIRRRLPRAAHAEPAAAPRA
jgi:hypothetical protein